MTTTGAVIYLSQARTCIQDDQHRSYQSLKNPFHDLIAFNDETLAPGASVTHNGSAVIIPLVGEVFTDQRIGPGQVQVTNYPTISNQYKEELINYLLISLKEKADTIVDFHLTNNQLQEIIAGVSIGKFDGRADGIYRPKGTAVFAFAIEGAFEVQNRLLHPRDGLALWDLTEVEFEALSNEALLLLIDVN